MKGFSAFSSFPRNMMYYEQGLKVFNVKRIVVCRLLTYLFDQTVRVSRTRACLDESLQRHRISCLPGSFWRVFGVVHGDNWRETPLRHG